MMRCAACAGRHEFAWETKACHEELAREEEAYEMAMAAYEAAHDPDAAYERYLERPVDSDEGFDDWERARCPNWPL